MTKIKLCGLKSFKDMEAANRCRPDYVGFVFVPKSRRFVTPEQAAALRARLNPDICPVGVFANEEPGRVARLLESGVIAMAQLHGQEDEMYLQELRALTNRPLIKAFAVDGTDVLTRAEKCSADVILLDSPHGGSGTAFDWTQVRAVTRPYFLAGGLTAQTVCDAIRTLHPWAVDVSSGIEINGVKDPDQMAAFVAAVREQDRKDECR